MGGQSLSAGESGEAHASGCVGGQVSQLNNGNGCLVWIHWEDVAVQAAISASTKDKWKHCPCSVGVNYKRLELENYITIRHVK